MAAWPISPCLLMQGVTQTASHLPKWSLLLNIQRLVGGFKHDFYEFHFIKKGCHPNPIDEHSIIFQDGHIAPPTRRYSNIFISTDCAKWRTTPAKFQALSSGFCWPCPLLGAWRRWGDGMRMGICYWLVDDFS